MLIRFLLLAYICTFSFAGSTIQSASASDDAPQYIGKQNCRECHTKLYKSFEDVFKRGQKKPRRLPNSTGLLADLGSVKGHFEESSKAKGHSKYKTKEKARVNLSKLNIDWEKNYSKDPKCLKCHSTGYGKATGYDPEKPNPNLSGVTCEACHGPGSKYVPYMEKAAEKYQREDALKHGMNNLQKDNGKANCKDACHYKTDDCPIIAAIDGYSFDWEKRHHKAHDSKTGSW